MNFDSTSGSIRQAQKTIAQKKLQALALELGVRDDNEHVGTGFGGNNGQLYALMGFHHELVNTTLTIKIDRGNMQWGVDWITASKMSVIRQELDSKFPIPKNTSLDTIQHDPTFSNGPNVSNWDDLTYANRICAGLSTDLDNGILSKVGSVAKALVGFPMEMWLLSIRMQIGIERLVKYNLDEHANFGTLLSAVNRALNY